MILFLSKYFLWQCSSLGWRVIFAGMSVYQEIIWGIIFPILSFKHSFFDLFHLGFYRILIWPDIRQMKPDIRSDILKKGQISGTALNPSLIHLFSLSVTHWFIHPLFYPYIYPFIHQFIHSFIESLNHKYIRSLNHSFIHSIIYSLYHDNEDTVEFLWGGSRQPESFIYPLNHLFSHSIIYLLIHSIICLIIYSFRMTMMRMRKLLSSLKQIPVTRRPAVKSPEAR